IAHFPVLDEIDPDVRLRSIQGQVIDKAKAMYEPRRAIVSLIRDDAARLCGHLDLLEQIAMITLFDPQDVTEIVIVQGRDMRRIGTEAVFSNDELEVRMILAQLGHKTFGGIPFTIIFVRAIAVHNRLGHERNDGPLVRVDDRGAQYLMRIDLLYAPPLRHVTTCCINRFQAASRIDIPFCGGEKMTPAWAQRQAELLRDCIVSPDVFASMVDRLCDFVMPYQHALETEAGKRHLHLYLVGLLSHLDRKNAEKIAAFVDVERLVIQEFIGTAPWDHRPLIKV